MYVDPATQSVGIVVNANQQQPQIFNVGTGSPNCTTGSSGVTCTLTLSAPYGSDTFAISLYSGPSATGAVIGTATASGDVTSGAPFAIDATVSANYIAYLPQGAGGIVTFNESGVQQTALPIPATQVALDDAGDIYDLYIQPTPAPSGTPSPGTVKQYPAGSTTASATYVASLPYPAFVLASGTGAVAVLSEDATQTYFNVDVWNPGTVGAPSFTIPLSTIAFAFFASLRHDGTLYLEDNTGTSLTYYIYPPGSSTATRTITETIVSPADIANFTPNYMTVGPDGTLYVTEYSGGQPDPLAGLYIYPPSGPERFVATTSDANGAGVEGVDLDAAGNVYVANNNEGILINTCVPGPPLSCQLQADSLHDIEVFAPGATSLLRHITGNFDPIAIAASPDGTVFFTGFPIKFFGMQTAGQQGSYIVAPGGSTATQFTADAQGVLSIYDGYEEHTASNRRRSASLGAGGVAHGGGASFARYMLTRRIQSMTHMR